MAAKRRILWLPVLVFCIAFLAVPVFQWQGLRLIPGDISDARLNNYFLENIYQYFAGGSASFWNLGFFAPFPWISGFSDNLFGSAPLYLLARLATGQPDTAFQLWFMAGYLFNFAAAYYALRRLGGSILASTIGALVFAFALPTTAHAFHAQLHFRFGAPLALAFFILFLEQRDFRFLVIAAGWTVWQFYCGIYIGFFTLLLLGLTAASHLLFNRIAGGMSVVQSLREFAARWDQQQSLEKALLLALALALILALIVLFYPYVMVTRVYGSSRPWAEIATMLPRPQSYFLSDVSLIWSAPHFEPFARLPMRQEHQMFFGLVPMLLAGLGVLVGWRHANRHVYLLMAGMIAGTVILTVNINGLSLWYLFHFLPLASAIRAMSRVDQVLLFPIAYFVMTGIDGVRRNWRWSSPWLPAVSLILLVTEFSLVSMPVSEKAEWRDRLAARETTLPASIETDSILMFAQATGNPVADELDSMWASLRRGVATMNGYSGHTPPGASLSFGTRCAEIVNRVRGFLISNGTVDDTASLELLRRIVPIGFDDCDPELQTRPLQIWPTSVTADEESFLLLPSNAGVIRDGMRRTDKQRGYLFYGPYRPVKAGTYRLQIAGSAIHLADATVDVVSDRGQTTHARHPVSPVPAAGLLLDGLVHIPENARDLEIRFFVGEADELVVTGYDMIAIGNQEKAP